MFYRLFFFIVFIALAGSAQKIPVAFQGSDNQLSMRNYFTSASMLSSLVLTRSTSLMSGNFGKSQACKKQIIGPELHQ
jgi:hypothetical protein